MQYSISVIRVEDTEVEWAAKVLSTILVFISCNNDEIIGMYIYIWDVL